MKTKLCRHTPQAYILLVTMVFVGLGVLLLTTIMNWTSENSRLTDRNNEYYATAAAAEAATEKVLVRISRDYISGGNALINANLANYSSLIPLASEYAYWSNYTFINPSSGASGSIYVDQYQPASYVALNGQYAGLNGYDTVYRIISNAQLNNSRNGNLRAGVEQYVATESIPLFQFAIFYNEDLEFNPSPSMTVNGRVHSNGNIYFWPQNTLTFTSDVTATGTINLTWMPGDPQGNRGYSGAPLAVFDGADDGGTSSLTLPIGTNSSINNVEQILQIPPTGEAINSALGSERMYNKSDLIILVSDSGVTVESGPFLGVSPVTVPDSQWTNFVTTTAIIYNARENANVRTIQFDVNNFNAWLKSPTNVINNSTLLAAADEPAISKVYIADLRTSGSYEPGVYLKDGAQLPPTGLTISTPDPVYIQGDYNVTDSSGSSLGANDTTHTYPAAVMGDAITILSDNWKDSNSSGALSARTASDTTVNAALLAGIVPTGVYNGSPEYSGGVENFTRFMENWSGKNLWYNGSMVVMFDSQIAKAPWTGTGGNLYNPPGRKWAFDLNFNNPNKLPPGTPLITHLERVNWAFQAPGVVPL